MLILWRLSDAAASLTHAGGLGTLDLDPCDTFARGVGGMTYV